MMSPEIITLRAQPYAYGAHTVALAQVGGAAEQGFATVSAFLDRHGLAAAGVPFIRYRRIDMTGTLDIETGIPVRQVGTANADIGFDMLPAGRYGQLCWTGPYDELLVANTALIAWGKENGIAWAMIPTAHGDIFDCRLERFRVGPTETDDPQQWITEIAIRIADGAAAGPE